MDALVTTIKSSQDPAQLLTYLNHHSNVIAQQSIGNVTQALSALDPSEHSLGYLILL